MHQAEAQQFIKFRVNNFQLITVHFSKYKTFSDNDPILEISKTGVRYCTIFHTHWELEDCLNTTKHDLSRSIIDFWIITKGSELTLATYYKQQYVKIGTFNITNLESYPYVGFSSKKETNWTLEEGEWQIFLKVVFENLPI